jgi:hypothetical protein
MDRGWDGARHHLEMVNWAPGRAAHMFSIIDSVIDAGAEDLLAVTTSMHDLIVVPKPTADPPLDVLKVCAPSSIHKVPDGTVRIMFLAVNGANTEIDRPVSEAVPLFWRFLDIEFGISRRPQQPNA